MLTAVGCQSVGPTASASCAQGWAQKASLAWRAGHPALLAMPHPCSTTITQSKSFSSSITSVGCIMQALLMEDFVIRSEGRRKSEPTSGWMLSQRPESCNQIHLTLSWLYHSHALWCITVHLMTFRFVSEQNGNSNSTKFLKRDVNKIVTVNAHTSRHQLQSNLSMLMILVESLAHHKRLHHITKGLDQSSGLGTKILQVCMVQPNDKQNKHA